MVTSYTAHQLPCITEQGLFMNNPNDVCIHNNVTHSKYMQKKKEMVTNSLPTISTDRTSDSETSVLPKNHKSIQQTKLKIKNLP